MNAREIEVFRQMLLRQRQVLIEEVTHVQADLEGIAADRESELEEAAQEERSARLLARLDDRGRLQLQDIEQALLRIRKGEYGRCEGCGQVIRRGRLAALPATRYCRDCAQQLEKGQSLGGEGETPGHPGTVPADYSLLTDRELEEVIREHVRDDGRVDLEELRIVCRHGIVHLDGALPSEAEHQILLHTVTDVMGLTEIDDRLRVTELLWEREERAKSESPQGPVPWEEAARTEDVAESQEDGVDFEAPSRPNPEEV